jgi:hypothetical protein
MGLRQVSQQGALFFAGSPPIEIADGVMVGREGDLRPTFRVGKQGGDSSGSGVFRTDPLFQGPALLRGFIKSRSRARCFSPIARQSKLRMA